MNITEPKKRYDEFKKSCEQFNGIVPEISEYVKVLEDIIRIQEKEKNDLRDFLHEVYIILVSNGCNPTARARDHLISKLEKKGHHILR